LRSRRASRSSGTHEQHHQSGARNRSMCGSGRGRVDGNGADNQLVLDQRDFAMTGADARTHKLARVTINCTARRSKSRILGVRATGIPISTRLPVYGSRAHDLANSHPTRDTPNRYVVRRTDNLGTTCYLLVARVFSWDKMENSMASSFHGCVASRRIVSTE